MNDMYTNGGYLEQNPEWHSEDSLWKAEQIISMLDKHQLDFQKVGEVGCGVGEVLKKMADLVDNNQMVYHGYDISPQAIKIAKESERKNLHFSQQDIFANSEQEFDMLMAIDVFEHVPDYMGFLRKCVQKAQYKIYHIPLDLHISSLLRNKHYAGRYTIGHLHYFTADTALATLRDTGHEIIDFCYTRASIDLFRQHPSIKKALANIPRYVVSKYSVSLSARLFGGCSLLVLAR